MTDGFVGAFDLETIANPLLIHLLPEPVPNGTMKDPDKIKADLDKKRDKQIADMGKKPHLNMICCAVIKDIGTGESTTLMLNQNTMDEGVLLEQIWDVLSGFQQFTTFNGNTFDVECLRFHSMLNKVKMSVEIDQHPYRIGNHIDIRSILGKGKEFARGTQDFFSRIILGEEEGEATGSQIQQMWDDGDYEGIATHCEDDVEKLVRIYQRMDGYYGF